MEQLYPAEVDEATSWMTALPAEVGTVGVSIQVAKTRRLPDCRHNWPIVMPAQA
jgi:hypothetical protein